MSSEQLIRNILLILVLWELYQTLKHFRQEKVGKGLYHLMAAGLLVLAMAYLP